MFVLKYGIQNDLPPTFKILFLYLSSIFKNISILFALDFEMFGYKLIEE